MKKSMALILALSIAALVSMVPGAQAKGRQADDPVPECQFELDGCD